MSLDAVHPLIRSCSHYIKRLSVANRQSLGRHRNTRYITTTVDAPPTDAPLPTLENPGPILHPPVLTTIYKMPSLEPFQFKFYDAKHLYLPFRKDILHRAVIYEGDMTRQGSASTKHRSEVHGSGRKIRPQKGTGRARLGDSKSPMLRGGGVAHGPKPRDFSTGLPRKVYDLAWRTALSFRYRRGELLVYRGPPLPNHEIAAAISSNGWAIEKGWDLIVPPDYIDDSIKAQKDRPKTSNAAKVDVKDLLKCQRLVIHEAALDRMLYEHQTDLVPRSATKIIELKY